MAKKYHLSDNGPKPCTAKSPETCPIRAEGGGPSEHYRDREKAQAAFEEKMEKEHGLIAKSAKSFA